MRNFYTQPVREVLEQVTGILEKYENGDQQDMEAKTVDNIREACKIKRDAAINLQLTIFDLIAEVNNIAAREDLSLLKLRYNAR